MDLFFQGLAALNKGINIENMTHARGYFERALALDPDNLDALLGVGRVDYTLAAARLSDDRGRAPRHRRNGDRQGAFSKAERCARPRNHGWHPDSRPSARTKALPNSSELWLSIRTWPLLTVSWVSPKIFIGHPEETAAHENEALRLSPRDSFAWLWLHFAGAAKMNFGR